MIIVDDNWQSSLIPVVLSNRLRRHNAERWKTKEDMQCNVGYSLCMRCCSRWTVMLLCGGGGRGRGPGWSPQSDIRQVGLEERAGRMRAACG